MPWCTMGCELPLCGTPSSKTMLVSRPFLASCLPSFLPTTVLFIPSCLIAMLLSSLSLFLPSLLLPSDSCGGGVRFWVLDLVGQRAHVMLSADLLSWEMGKEKQERSMEMYNWQLWNKLPETGEGYGDVQLATLEQTSRNRRGVWRCTTGNFGTNFQTHKRFKRTPFIRTRQNQLMLGVVPFVKLQNNT